MFTGIISHQGRFKAYQRGKQELAVEAPPDFSARDIGESIAVNGVCLTLAGREGDILSFDISQETLAKTNLGALKRGGRLNLELSLTLQSPLSGHLVTGHIDGKGKVLRIMERPSGRRLVLSFPPALRSYLVPKGSIAVNGVSLTIALLKRSALEVELIPLTIAKSNLKDLRRGQEVNLECDIIGKYVYNWVAKMR
jgi:riboflavin synthase